MSFTRARVYPLGWVKGLSDRDSVHELNQQSQPFSKTGVLSGDLWKQYSLGVRGTVFFLGSSTSPTASRKLLLFCDPQFLYL